MYVISKDAGSNTITVGYGAQTQWDTVQVRDVFWRHESFTPDTADTAHPIYARIRHGGELYPAEFTWIDQATAAGQVKFTQAIKGLAPGQAVVFYDATDDRVCLGGGQQG